MVPTAAPTGCSQRKELLTNLGFLTVLHEGSGYLGGYLVTNIWGRPVEFRLSSAVQPNRVQQVLYAATLEPYIYADLIGKALVDKAATVVQLIVADCEPALDLRLRVDCPVLLLTPPGRALNGNIPVVRPAQSGHGALLHNPKFPEDLPRARELLTNLDISFDLAEPFVRIREAIGEARKMGVQR